MEGEAAQVLYQGQVRGGGGDSVDNINGECILSLDGGGVRGLSGLYILRNIMTHINRTRRNNGEPLAKPCEIFDLIGGTNTGGLAAILLGRLHMTVDDCIAEYRDILRAVFEDGPSRGLVDDNGNIQARFSTEKFRDAIEAMLARHDLPMDEPLFEENSICKVFVCVTRKDLIGVTHLRSYDTEFKRHVPATIVEAILATSAASGLFEPVTIGKTRYVDGAFGANNPSEEVEGEAQSLYNPPHGSLNRWVKCFISIGTGMLPPGVMEDNREHFLARTLMKIATETEETARKFIARWQVQYSEKRYFRFNVQHGLETMDVEGFEKEYIIEGAVDRYLQDVEQILRMKSCVHNMCLKQAKLITETNYL